MMDFVSKIISYIKKHKYIFIFLFIFVSFLPFLLHFYPGLVIVDTYSQLRQIIGLSELTNHHPIFHTFLLSIFYKIANIFSNDNVIILLNSIFQMTMMSLVFTYSIYHLDKKNIKTKFLVFIYALYPVFGIYSIYTSKDTMFAVSVLFYIIELSKLIDNPKETFSSKRNIFLLIFSSIFVILFRNQGIFVVLITIFLAILFLRKYAIKISIIFIFLVVFFIFWTNFVFSFFDVKQTEKVENLAIPLQQINYIVYYKYDELDIDTINRISRFIDVDVLRKNYDKNRIDSIKKYFDEDYYNQNQYEFFNLSFDLFKKYPGDSFQSFWLKNRKFIYPFRYVHIINLTFKQKKFIDIYRDSILDLPVVDYVCYDLTVYNEFDIFRIFLFNPSTNFYLMLLLFIYSLLKNKKYIIPLTAIFIVWISVLLSPGSGYRYVLPVVLCSPYLIYYILNTENRFNILCKRIVKKYYKIRGID